jgi:hypothetical protein
MSELVLPGLSDHHNYAINRDANTMFLSNCTCTSYPCPRCGHIPDNGFPSLRVLTDHTNTTSTSTTQIMFSLSQHAHPWVVDQKRLKKQMYYLFFGGTRNGPTTAPILPADGQDGFVARRCNGDDSVDLSPTTTTTTTTAADRRLSKKSSTEMYSGKRNGQLLVSSPFRLKFEKSFRCSVLAGKKETS